MNNDFVEADFISAIGSACSLIALVLGESPESVCKRLLSLGYNRTFAEYQNYDMPENNCRIAELMAPLNYMDPMSDMARNYIEQTLRDAWTGHNGKCLMDALLFASALLEQGRMALQEEDGDDEVCPACGSDRFVLFDDGTANCFDCLGDEDTLSTEEVQEAVEELEKRGLVESEWLRIFDFKPTPLSFFGTVTRKNQIQRKSLAQPPVVNIPSTCCWTTLKPESSWIRLMR